MPAPIKSREQNLEELATTMLSMLTDLYQCWGWDQLCDTFDNVESEAKALGITIDDEAPSAEPPAPDGASE